MTTPRHHHPVLMSALLLPLALLLPALAGCGGGKSGEAGGSGVSYTAEGQAPLASDAAISRHLHDAEMAFVDGNWDAVVSHATRVLDAHGSKEQTYEAKKLLGLAGCNRRDSRLIKDAWELMADRDRTSIKRECAKTGLVVHSDGSVGITAQ